MHIALCSSVMHLWLCILFQASCSIHLILSMHACMHDVSTLCLVHLLLFIQSYASHSLHLIMSIFFYSFISNHFIVQSSILFYTPHSRLIILFIQLYPSCYMHLIICISFCAFHTLHLIPCISFYASLYMHCALFCTF